MFSLPAFADGPNGSRLDALAETGASDDARGFKALEPLSRPFLKSQPRRPSPLRRRKDMQ